MAVLSAATPAGETPGLVRFTGAEQVLAAQRASLPQPDQMCGPFAAHVALHALARGPQAIPGLLELARCAGTRVYPEDLPEARPPGVESVPLGWDELPHAPSPYDGGTEAAGLAAGLISCTGGMVGVVPVRQAAPGPWPAYELTTLLGDVAAAPYPVGVVANVATGPLGGIDGDTTWDVGHFVVIWGLDADAGLVALADNYVQLTGEGMPPGCRLVTVEALGEALGQEPGRGLLLLAPPERAALLAERSVELGMVLEAWRA
ncbi:hypothetical protein GCM10009737_04630 [Nocardioides lentus]|uniref:Peptidase C39-like domain-containing protein n=1 Tax=Nocardioides lentus TaxID=338077 RepID=A0ABP5AB92_9ACTN